MNKSEKISINIIGYGYVGSSMGYLCERNNVEFNVCDLNSKEGGFNYFNNVSELVNFSETNSDINFYVIAVPTPSDTQGNCDTSIVRNILSQLRMLVNKETYVIIKSTLVPGTSNSLNIQFPTLNIVFCPEFLREATYKDDIYNAQFVLLGIPPKFDMVKYQKVLRVIRIFYKHNTQIDILMRSYEECEIFKYSLNCFFATKIWYFNKIYQVCESMDVDYQKLKELFKLDSRIGDYGTTVPGSDNKFGFGLSCLPKECRGMSRLLDALDLDSTVFKQISRENDILRQL
jgi:UDPglucose 6-dehydrogenase